MTFISPTLQCCSRSICMKTIGHRLKYISIIYFTAKSNSALTEPFCAKCQGMCHASDLIPAFGFSLRYSQLFSDEEKNISTKLIDTFTHFTKKRFKFFQKLDFFLFLKVNNFCANFLLYLVILQHNG